MSRFYVGQRVKKVRGPFAGMFTGVIAEIDPQDPRSLGVAADAGGIGWDCEDALHPFPAGAVVFGYPDEFEPVDEGRQVVSWQACLWQPEPQQEIA